jgi:hypothetical protein
MRCMISEPAPVLHMIGNRPAVMDWLYCEKCRHSAPIACAVPVIRWVLTHRAISSVDVPGAWPAAPRAPRSSVRDGVVPMSASCRFLCTCSGPSSGGKAKGSTLYDGGPLL